MRKLLTQLRPSRFEEIIAVLALYRPGPLGSGGMVEQYIRRKHGGEEVRYAHPWLEPVLRDTYGVIVYQEQVMQIGQVLAGYTLGEADELRSAMGKKSADKMAREEVRFLEGARKKGVDEKKARELEQKLRKNAFTLEDFRDQMAQVRKMGSMEEILSMIPGMGKLKQMKQFKVDEKEFVRITAIIDSMTAEERRKHQLINASRRKRIAKGSGTTVQQVNQLLKSYVQVQKMIKKMNKGGLRMFGRAGLPF